VRIDEIHRRAHLVQFLRTDIRAVGESKVDEGPITEEILFGEWLVVVCLKGERPADRRSADGFGGVLLACRRGWRWSSSHTQVGRMEFEFGYHAEALVAHVCALAPLPFQTRNRSRVLHR
jgi:hypothetical protein